MSMDLLASIILSSFCINTLPILCYYQWQLSLFNNGNYDSYNFIGLTMAIRLRPILLNASNVAIIRVFWGQQKTKRGRCLRLSLTLVRALCLVFYGFLSLVNTEIRDLFFVWASVLGLCKKLPFSLIQCTGKKSHISSKKFHFYSDFAFECV